MVPSLTAATAVALLASGWVASVSAGSVHANHRLLHRKSLNTNTDEAACAFTTYTTTWYGEAGLAPGPTSTSTSSTTSSSTSSWVAPTTSTSEAPAPVYTSAAPPPPPPETTSTWVAPTTSGSSEGNKWGLPSLSLSLPIPTPSAGVNTGDSPISSNGDKWAMTYTPYADNGDCKSASQVASDIAQIALKGFTTVRLYATDCSGVQNAGAAAKQHGLKLILGIYLDQSGLGNGYAQLSTLTSWGQSNGWDHVEMVVAGNEAIFNNFVSASEMAGFIGDVKSKFQAAGFTGPVTTTEPLGTIQENGGVLCPVVDVIAANIHPFFNTDVDAAGAGSFVSSQLSLLAQVCNNQKTAYNLETGWPSKGDANGAAVPSEANQRTAVDSIVNAAGGKSAIFSFSNDMWKAPGALGIEQYWGSAHLFSDQ